MRPIGTPVCILGLMSGQVEVLVDCLHLRGDWRELVHTVLSRAHKQYTRPELES